MFYPFQSLRGDVIREKEKEICDIHPISSIQRFSMEKLVCTSCIEREYDEITNSEEITRIEQITINSLCDHTRKTIMENIEEAANDGGAIHFMTQGPNQIPSAVVLSQKFHFKTILGPFSTGTYAGIGT